jgi:uncharacterized protein DUF6497
VRGALLALLLALIALPLRAADGLHVPTGQVLLPYEALWEDHPDEGASGETWLVLRFLTPEIARDLGKFAYRDVLPDFDFICENIGLPLIESSGGGVDLLIVTLLDAPLARGALDRKVTQFNNIYRVDQGGCALE